MKITAMSFNLRVCHAADLLNSWPFRKKRVAELIKSQEPWVIGTQEGLSGMLRELDGYLPEYRRIGQGRRGGNKGEFNAIYYNHKRLLLLDQGQFWLSTQKEKPGPAGWDGRYPRICTWGRFKLARQMSSELRVYNTHLDHIGQEAQIRGAQLIWSTILEHQSNWGRAPVILTGDFNSGPESPVIQFLSGSEEIEGSAAELQNAFADPYFAGATFHNFKGGRQGVPIDYIFGGFGLNPLHGDVIRSTSRGRYPSDHYPVTAVFRLSPLEASRGLSIKREKAQTLLHSF